MKAVIGLEFDARGSQRYGWSVREGQNPDGIWGRRPGQGRGLELKKARIWALGVGVMGVIGGGFEVQGKEGESWTGKVVGVSDGDTLTVLHDKKPERIRLYGIDAPEKNQPFGMRAKQFTSEKVFGKIVTITEKSRDRYGRTVGRVMCEGQDINAEIVRAGLAWHYTQYDKSEALAQLESEARKAKRGLWADANPMPPWAWRRQGRAGAQNPVPHGVPSTSGVEEAFHGNVKSRVFHRRGCVAFDCPSCKAPFHNREEALKQGFRACGMCKPLLF